MRPFADITRRKDGKIINLVDTIELKEEAIKWIKHHESTGPWRDCCYKDGMMQFFNITEEELK